MDTMKVVHKPTGEIRMIKAFRFNSEIHKEIETYRDPNGDIQYATIIYASGTVTQKPINTPEEPQQPQTEEEKKIPEQSEPAKPQESGEPEQPEQPQEIPVVGYDDLERFKLLQEKGWKNLNSVERKEYKELKAIFIPS